MSLNISSVCNYREIEPDLKAVSVTSLEQKVILVAGAVLVAFCATACLGFSVTWRGNCVGAASRKLASIWDYMQSFFGKAARATYPPDARFCFDPGAEKITSLLGIVKASQLRPGVSGALNLAYGIGLRAGLGIPQHRSDYDALVGPFKDGSETSKFIHGVITLSAITAGVSTSRSHTSFPEEIPKDKTCCLYYGQLNVFEEITNSLKIKNLSPSDLVTPEELSRIIRWLNGNDDKACQFIAGLIPNMTYLKELVDILLSQESQRKTQTSPGFVYQPHARYFDVLAGIHRFLGKEPPLWLPEWIEFLEDESAITPFIGYLFIGEIWLGRSSLPDHIHEPPPIRTVEITLQWMERSHIRLATMGRFLSACVSRKFVSASRVETTNSGFSYFYGGGSVCNIQNVLYDVGGFSDFSYSRPAIAYFHHHLLSKPHEFSSYLDQLEELGGFNALMCGIHHVAAMIESGKINGCSQVALALADRLIRSLGVDDDELIPKSCQVLVALGKAQGKQMRATFRVSAKRKSDCPKTGQRPIGITPWIAQVNAQGVEEEKSFWREGAALLTHVEKRCIELNNSLHPGMQQDIAIFMAMHEADIMNLVRIVGVNEAQRHLNYYLSLDGFSPLQRFLAVQRVPSADDLVALRQIYTRLKRTGGTKKQKAKDLPVVSSEWQRILLIYSVFCQFDASKLFHSMAAEAFAGKDSLSLVLDLERRGGAVLFNKLKKRLGIKDQEFGIGKKTSTERILAVAKELPVLLKGRDFLAQNFPPYCEIFDALSLRMIRGDTPEAIFAFLNDSDQDDELGQIIANHNAAIADRFMKLGVNFKTYWQGIAPKSFTLAKAASDPQSVLDDRSWALSSILAALPLLSKEYSQVVEKSDNALLKRQFEGLSNLFGKVFLGLGIADREKIKDKSFYKEVAKRFKKVSSLNILSTQLGRAIKTASSIDKDPVICSARIGKRKLTEFVRHAMDAAKRLQETVKTSEKVSYKSKESRGPFLVRVWNRDPLHCLVIGKQVHCCLSPNSDSQFQALIERYVDGAMNVVEVVDREGVTVSLAWLFLAESNKKASEQGADLVINFLEMDPDVQKNSATRDCILEELLGYTKEFAKQIGAKRLLARSQEYGGLPNHETLKVNVSLRKVGKTIFEEPYYLEAEKRSFLHLLWQRA